MVSAEEWLDKTLPLHNRVKGNVISILESLLRNAGIEYLSVSGRTKDRVSALEKIKRKGYGNPAQQLTDLTGIRVILFLESDVARVSEVIKNGFCVDVAHSLDKGAALAADQIGYRSYHFVCDIGPARQHLPEFEGLGELKFEIQVRTVLQHAWAELSHDRNYKFGGKLPAEIEREMYLFAGLLELADKGFSQVAARIDEHARQIVQKAEGNDYSFALDTISLTELVHKWAADNRMEVEDARVGISDYRDLLAELKQFGVETGRDLLEIIPINFAEVAHSRHHSSTIHGYVRDWMLVHDWRKFLEKVDFRWSIDVEEDSDLLPLFFEEDELRELRHEFRSREWRIEIAAREEL